MIKLAYSSLCCHYIDDILSLAKCSPSKAIEWDMNFIPPTISSKRNEGILSYIKDFDIEIRYHLPYSFLEIAHTNPDIRSYSILTIKKYLNYIKILNGQYAVLHVGYDNNSSESIALQSLQSIALYAKELNIHVCIENLIKGLTTNILFIEQALEIDGIYLCLDTGHAHAVSLVQDNYLSSLFKLLEKCRHAHVYYTEDQHYNHLQFEDSQCINKSTIINSLLSTKCNWFTMELDQKVQQENQIRMFKEIHKQQ